MYEEIIDYLRSCSEGASTGEIAGNFFRISNPGSMAEITVKNILSKDKRIFQDQDGRWYARSPKSSDSLGKLPLCGVYILGDPGRKTEQIYYLSIWEIFPAPKLIWEAWTKKTESLSFEDRQALDIGEEIRAAGESGAVFSQLADELKSRLPVFLSCYHENLLRTICVRHGENFTDDSILAGELLTAAGISSPRPLSTGALFRSVMGHERSASSALAQGELYAECLAELINTLRLKGIETRQDLEEREKEERRRYFEGKKFTFDDISSLSQVPGVYGFKDEAGKFLYIGKAKNLRRRLMSYFRETDESPLKIQSIHRDSKEVVTYQCGSELECLLYEYRLIRKPKPLLNSQTEIGERKGTFSPVEDCIILLPHTSEEKVMSFWFRKDQKIQIKPLDTNLNHSEELLKELERFFLGEKLPADSQDFPEMEIATRWVKKHRDSLTTVPVSRFGQAEEILDSIKGYLKEISQERI